MRAAPAERRLRPLLQQGHVRGGRHHLAAQDARPSSTPTRSSSPRRKGDTYSQLGLHAELPRLRVDDHRTSRPSASPTYFTADGKSNVANDPALATVVQVAEGTWSTTLGGFAKLEKYRTTFGDEFGAKNPFMTGQVAMAHRRRVARRHDRRRQGRRRLRRRAVPGARRPGRPRTARATSPARSSASRAPARSRTPPGSS